MAIELQSGILPSTEFVKVEKNLASLGFFTPSSKRLRNATEKSFTITTVADGKRLELKGTIIPSAKYGLPITADQDKWIALCKILTDILRREGKVTNPISFTSAEILRLLHKHRHSGKNYREIEEWLDVLFSTTIFSEGVVYLANEKRRVKDRFRVFERAVSLGKELPDGKTADKNYVWFSDWQLQNINSNHLLPIDIEAYRELKNHIAKALVPLLQVWLYATRDEGVFEKRYDELCEFLNIQRYRYLSLIRRTLGPSLDELKEFGYLADWQIEKTRDEQNYKILFYHGDKFHRDRNARLNRRRSPNGGEGQAELVARSGSSSSRRKPLNEAPSRPQILTSQPRQSQATFDPHLVAEFTRRGIAEQKATEILANLKPGQDVVAQLESAEQTVKALQNSQTPVRNPAGFYIRLIERNTPVPDGFETSAKRTARLDRERKEREQRSVAEAKQQLEWEYDEYRDREIDRYIEANQAAFDAMTDAKRQEGRAKYSFTTESMAKLEARFEIQKQVPLLTFDEFLARKKQGTDFSLKPVAVSPDVEPATTGLQPEVSIAELPVETLTETEIVTEEPSQVTAERQEDVAQKSGESHVPESPGAEPRPIDEIRINQAGPTVIGDVSARMGDRGEAVQLSPEPTLAEPATPEPASITRAADGVAVDPVAPAIAADPPAAIEERGEVLSPEPAAPPIISEPVILLATEYPGEDPGIDTMEPHVV